MSECSESGARGCFEDAAEPQTSRESCMSDSGSTVLREEEDVDCLHLVYLVSGKNVSEGRKKIVRPLPEGVLIKVGRIAARSTNVGTTEGGDMDNHVWLTSKVISRSHAQIWKKGGIVYIRDLGSSSGTFLNKIRLSPTGQASRPYPLRNEDTLQLGIDYKWKSGEMYQSITFQVFIERKNARAMLIAGYRQAKFSSALNSLMTSVNPSALIGYEDIYAPSTCTPVECCLCLGVFGPAQAIFLAPCSHCYHYRCVYQILLQGIMFQCPMCRQYANLAANVGTESPSFSVCGTQGKPDSCPAPTPRASPASASTPALSEIPRCPETPDLLPVSRVKAVSDSQHLARSSDQPPPLYTNMKTPHTASDANINSMSSSGLRDSSLLKYLKTSISISDRLSHILKRRLCNVKLKEGNGCA